MTDLNKVIENALTEDFAAELSQELKVDISFDLSDVVVTLEDKAFLAAHEEMHRQYCSLQKPARVAEDVVINDKLMNSRIMVDTSGSMAGDSKLDWVALLRRALMKQALMEQAFAPAPCSAQEHQMLINTGGDTLQRSFSKPKYEKFKSNEAMIEEKLLTGRNRRSNKDIAAVRREARKLNKKLKVHLEKRMKNVRSVQTFTV